MTRCRRQGAYCDHQDTRKEKCEWTGLLCVPDFLIWLNSCFAQAASDTGMVLMFHLQFRIRVSVAPLKVNTPFWATFKLLNELTKCRLILAKAEYGNQNWVDYHAFRPIIHLCHNQHFKQQQEESEINWHDVSRLKNSDWRKELGDSLANLQRKTIWIHHHDKHSITIRYEVVWKSLTWTLLLLEKRMSVLSTQQFL